MKAFKVTANGGNKCDAVIIAHTISNDKQNFETEQKTRKQKSIVGSVLGNYKHKKWSIIRDKLQFIAVLIDGTSSGRTAAARSFDYSDNETIRI